MAKIITENFRVETTNELFRSFTEGNANIVSDFTAVMNDYVDSGSIALSNDDKTSLFGYFPNTLLDIMNNSQPDSTYYIMASSMTKGETITNTQFEKREFMRRVIFGSKVTQDDIRYMFDFNDWKEGTVYDAFDDNKDIASLNMYVTILDGEINEGAYKVYKCLSNNDGAASTIQPNLSEISADDYIHTTADGYVWKYMFEVPPSEYIVYSTTQSLPYFANQAVIDSARESISDIIIEQTPVGLFSGHTLGDVEVQQVSSLGSDVWEIELRTTTPVTIRAESNSYTNMYFTYGSYYDIIESFTPAQNPNEPETLRRFFIRIRFSGADLDQLLPKGAIYNVIPKVAITKSSGTSAKAYGELDSNGTLIDVVFLDRGDSYKVANATLALPPSIQDRASETSLRAIVSPRGGHGSDPISELYMSKLSIITNFFSSSLNAIPDSNTYTRVGLLKNPAFRDASQPRSLDNRMQVRVNGDITGEGFTNYFIIQTVGDETISARIHEITYDGSQSTLYLVDYIGAHAATFTAGEVEIKDTLDAVNPSGSYTINTVNESDKGLYTNYSGDLLHFVDFDPIERQEGRREKIKFVFDF